MAYSNENGWKNRYHVKVSPKLPNLLLQRFIHFHWSAVETEPFHFGFPREWNTRSTGNWYRSISWYPPLGFPELILLGCKTEEYFPGQEANYLLWLLPFRLPLRPKYWTDWEDDYRSWISIFLPIFRDAAHLSGWIFIFPPFPWSTPFEKARQKWTLPRRSPIRTWRSAFHENFLRGNL